MSEFLKTTSPILYPALLYRDSKAMIAWLEKAFGFVKHAAYETTQSVYVAVPDADAVFARAKAAGAKIVMGLTDQPTAAAISPARIRKSMSGRSAPTRQNLSRTRE